MPRTNYIFIDYENVCEIDLSRIVGKQARVFLIIGTKHKKLPVDYFLFAQDHPDQLRIIQTPVEGRNALDFVLTLELGRIIATDPDGCFHIISKDNDFKSIVSHLKGEKKLIARHSSLTEIPALRTAADRLERLRIELLDSCHSRPATRQKLENKINSMFKDLMEPNFVAKTIASFVQSDILSFTETGKISYKASGEIRACASPSQTDQGTVIPDFGRSANLKIA